MSITSTTHGGSFSLEGVINDQGATFLIDEERF